MLTYPTRYVARRTEHCTFLPDSAARWNVQHDIEIPQLPNDIDEDTATVIVTLGLYPKHRLPDLEATDPSGDRLSLLSRSERSQALASLFVSAWAKHLELDGRLQRIGDSSGALETRAIKSLRRVVSLCRRIFDANEPRAVRHLVWLLYALRSMSESGNRIRAAGYGNDESLLLPEFAERLLDSEVFWRQISVLARTTHVLAICRAVPGERRVISVTWTDKASFERISAPLSARDPWFRGKRTSRFLHWLDRLGPRSSLAMQLRDNLDSALNGLFRFLVLIGVMPLSLTRRELNAGHCESYYVGFGTASSISVVRLYWREYENERPRPEYVVQGFSTFLNYYAPGPHPSVGVDSLHSCCEVMTAQTPGLSLAIMISALVGVAAMWIYAHGDAFSQDKSGSPIGLLATLQLFTIVPGALIATLASASDAYSSYITRGPRVCAYAIAIAGASIGITYGLGMPLWTRTVAACSSIVLAIYSTIVFAAIQLGPRYRVLPNMVPRGDQPPAAMRSRHRLFAFGVLIVAFAACASALVLLTQGG